MKYSLVFALGVVSACAALTTDPLPNQIVDDSFTWDGVNWQSGGQLYFSIKAYEDSGKVAVCGLRSSSQRGPHDFDSLAIANMRIDVSGTTVLNDVGAFPAVGHQMDQPPVGSARCYRTSTDWEADMKPEEVDLVLNKRRFEILD